MRSLHAQNTECGLEQERAEGELYWKKAGEEIEKEKGAGPTPEPWGEVTTHTSLPPTPERMAHRRLVESTPSMPQW